MNTIRRFYAPPCCTSPSISHRELIPAASSRLPLLVAVLAVFVSSLAALPSARAQTAEDALLFSRRLPATGARSIGLAGAGRAGLGDYSDFFNNPAGLAYISNSQLAGSLNFLSATNESSVAFPDFDSVPFEEDLTEQSLSNLAGLYKLPTRQGSLVFGGAFNQTSAFSRPLFFDGLIQGGSITDVLLPFDDEFDVEEQSDGSFLPVFFADLPEIAYLGGATEFLFENVGTLDPLFIQAVDPTTTILQASEVFQEGRMNELSFGGSVEAARGVLIGASLNFSFGAYEFESIFEEIDVNNANSEEDYIVIDGDTQFRGFDRVTYTERFDSDLVGANLRVGLSAEAAPGLKLGVTIESPTFYRVDEQFETVIATDFDNGLFLSYGGQPGDIGRGSFEYDINTPWRFGGGLSYTIQGLTLMGDIELVDWSQLELDASTDRSFFNDINRTIRSNFEAVLNTNVAAEYRYQDLSLRVGFAYQPDPNEGRITLTDGTQTDPDLDKTFISAGIGYRFADKFQLDFGWMQESQDDIYFPDFTLYEVNEDVTRNHFQVGFTVLF